MTNNELNVRGMARYGARVFGRRVRDLRQARGWTQEELASRLSACGYAMHQTTVAKLESGTRPTSVEELHVLAALLGLGSVADFWDRGDPDTWLRVSRLESERDRLAAELAKVEQQAGYLRKEFEKADDLYRRIAEATGTVAAFSTVSGAAEVKPGEHQASRDEAKGATDGEDLDH